MNSGERHSAFVVDASVWVSRFIATEDRHIASRQWLRERLQSHATIVIPAVALPEIGGPLARRTGAVEAAGNAVRLLLRTPGIRVVPVGSALARSSARMAIQSRLRGADSVYVALAHRLGIPLVTWDREQIARGSGATWVLSPWMPA